MSTDSDLDVDEGLTTTPDDEGPQLHFPNVYRFVAEWLVEMYARPVRAQSSQRWCPQWWDHPEAVSRLEGLWSAFETLRQDPGLGPATWWRDYADPTMAALMDPAGPFARCSPDDHVLPPSLPTAPPSAWLVESPTPDR